MLFNSYIFIIIFLPITLLGYFLFNRVSARVGKLWLIAASLVFYAYGGVNYLWFIIFSAVVNYLVVYAMAKIRKVSAKNADKKTRLVCAIGIIINIGVLFYFKYFNFLIENINLFIKNDISLLELALPLGISFLTFQQIAYLVDSYRGEAVECSFFDYFTAVTFFPKVSSGPIINYNDIVPQLIDNNRKRINFDNFAKGIMAFSFGLAKKVMLADNFGSIASFGYGSIGSLNSIEAIMTILAYTFQLYFDFSGYCDMVTGIGLMFNIDMPMNFNSPYKALNIIDFWKRWHITLTKFLTKYVYIPLGGSRKGTVRTYINIIIVFLVSGIWHGAGYTFIIWGLIHGVTNALTRIFKDRIEKVPKVINWLITFILVNIGWIYFRADSISSANTLISRVFTGGFGELSADLLNTISQPAIFSVLGRVSSLSVVIVAFYVFAFIAVLFMKNTNERIDTFKPGIKYAVVSIVLFVYSLLSLSGICSFLYTNF